MKIKLCLFCGREIEESDFYEFTGWWCLDCCIDFEFFNEDCVIAIDWEEAIKAWNTRSGEEGGMINSEAFKNLIDAGSWLSEVDILDCALNLGFTVDPAIYEIDEISDADMRLVVIENDRINELSDIKLRAWEDFEKALKEAKEQP